MHVYLQVMIEVGGDEFVACDVSSASATQLVCSVTSRCQGMPTGIPLTLSVRINNYGYAMHTQLAKTDRAVVILPSVTSVTPSEGSTQGGQLITILGTNLCRDCGDGACVSRRKRSNLQDLITLDGGSIEHVAIGVNLCDVIESECK